MVVASAADLSAPTLAAGLLAVVAASFTAAGLRRQRYRGFGWWAAALWLAAAGATAGALPALRGSGLATGPLLCGLGLLQWPLLTLLGLRRFDARGELPGSPRTDASIGAVALLLQVGGLAAGEPVAAAGAALATLVVHGYASALLFGSADGPDGGPLQGLAAALALAALVPLGALAADLASPEAMLAWRAGAAGLGAVAMAFSVLTLLCERTERQLRESRRRLRVLAHVDPLTQLPNRRRFHELAGRSARLDRPGSAVLLTFDIDHFKRINDELGHAAGDRALCAVSSSLLEMLRAQDVAARLGGDEFALLLRDAGTREAMVVATRLVAAVQRRARAEGLPRTSLSIGMVQLRAGEALDEALRRADQALYEAKRQGRSRAVAAHGDEERPVFVESRRLGLTPG
jgi:diguanylate cyclase (GGDEF)-like protein